MKNLLNNHWLIVALAIVAVLMLVRSIIQPFSSESGFEDTTDAYDWLDNTDAEDQAGIKSVPLQAVSTSNIFWNTHPERDPFSPDRLINSHDVRAIQYQAEANSGDIGNRQPVLSALVAGQFSKFAIIDGKIMQEGESAGEFRVGRIARDGVWLHYVDRSIKLDLARQAK